MDNSKSVQEIIVLGPIHPYRGGIATFNQRLSEELTSQGHDVINFNFSVQYPKFLFPGKTQYTSDPGPKDLITERVVSSLNPINWIQVGRRIRKISPDIIICSYWMPFFAPCLGTILKCGGNKVRKIGLVHNLIPHERKPGDKFLTKYFVENCDEFIVLSDKVKKEILSVNSRKNICLLSHPIYDNYGSKVNKEMAKEKLGLDSSKNYLLFFGLIREYKGLDLLLEALSLEICRSYDLKLIVAGEFYENRSKYDEIIERNGTKSCVDFFDYFIPNEQVKYFFSASDLVVQPYKTASQSGISQIALNFDCPMIVTDVGGLAEIVDNEISGFVVAPEIEGLRMAINRLYTENRFVEFKKGAAIKKKEFGWKSFVKRFIDSDR